jgi:3-hydroxy-3-methylglutaryl CoA synthase
MTAGIDDIAIYIPRLYIDAADFAENRGLDPVKLQKGLGVSQMAIVDANQDPACLAANACLRIMQKINFHLMTLVDYTFQLNQHLMNQRQ